MVTLAIMKIDKKGDQILLTSIECPEKDIHDCITIFKLYNKTIRDFKVVEGR